MIRKPISFPNRSPLTGEAPALLVREASRFESRLMIEHNAKIVNAKSMLGLLSLARTPRRAVLLPRAPMRRRPPTPWRRC